MERGIDVLLRWLWEWKGLVQREGQARSPTKSEGDRANAKPYKYTNDCSTKSEWDSANAKPYKHTDDCSTKSEWDSADFEMGCVGRGAVSDNNTKAVTV